QNSDAYDPKTKEFYGAEPIESVAINYEKAYRSILQQDTLTYQGIELQNFGGFFGLDSPAQSRKAIAKTPYGILYSEARPGEVEDLLVESFVLGDDGVADVTWNTGKRNTDTFQLVNTTGCGAGAFLALVAPSVTSRLVSAGVAANGDAVYEFSNADNPVARFLYDTNNGTYYSGDGEARTLTFQEFSRKHPVLIVKDALGRYVVYNNSAYGPAVECGKPVIYLYPDEPTEVSVRVDAAIRVSDPSYGNGWYAHASPDGTLTMQDGSTYDSLFWEGQGSGAYPRIRSGFVVPRTEVSHTIDTHLRQLGLHKKEREDFEAFWLPRMPDSSHVRLSWLTTREMNELAPLDVRPQPDTVIRVFLDFEGIDHLIDLPQQKLTAPPRTGFTLVEWGGLLRK
ncbi:hypothetical protein HYV71_01120, partial [Candidatus Uhrbacteria bacterium]|nr:hypothetical protein [Candidatus Uhrbacteria bacterium]